MSCPVCRGSGYRTVDIGTITIPDFVDVPCRCNPEPTDADAPDWWDMDLPGVDHDRRFNDARYEGL